MKQDSSETAVPPAQANAQPTPQSVPDDRPFFTRLFGTAQESPPAKDAQQAQEAKPASGSATDQDAKQAQDTKTVVEPAPVPTAETNAASPAQAAPDNTHPSASGNGDNAPPASVDSSGSAQSLPSPQILQEIKMLPPSRYSVRTQASQQQPSE
jgi:hypothetical protein